VLVAESGGAEKHLVGYVVSAAGVKVTPDELRRDLRERLPAHMVPPVLVVLDELPLTANGKVDRKALAELDLATPRAHAEFVAPSTAVEKQLADIWCEVLGLERVGIHDDFFELGGHSLLATQVMARVRKVLGVEVPLRNLFQSPTVSNLARVIEQSKAQSSRAPRIQVSNRRKKTLEHLLAEVSQLTEIEAQRLVQERKSLMQTGTSND
jgi:acyl carrier protein